MKDIETVLDLKVCELCTTCTYHSIDKAVPMWNVETVEGKRRIASTDPSAVREDNKIRLKVLNERDADNHYLCGYPCPPQAITLYEDGVAVPWKQNTYLALRKKYT